MFNGRLKSKLISETLQERGAWSLPDTHGAVALHIAVTAYRACACTGASKMTAKQKKVDDLLDVRHRVLVLRETHRPAADHGL